MCMGILFGWVDEDRMCTRRKRLQPVCCCDTDTKNQVETSSEYSNLEMSLDSMGLLIFIKRLVYTGGTYNLNLNVYHNKAMVHMNLMTYDIVSGKVSRYTRIHGSVHGNEEVIWWARPKIWRCEDDEQPVLKEKCINQTTTTQLKHATNTVEEDYNAILFLYKIDREKYGKLIKQLENDILHRMMHVGSLLDQRTKMTTKIQELQRQTMAWHLQQLAGQ